MRKFCPLIKDACREDCCFYSENDELTNRTQSDDDPNLDCLLVRKAEQDDVLVRCELHEIRNMIKEIIDIIT